MTTEELLKAYAEGKRDFRGAYLGGAYLGDADLRDADLRGAYLGGADLGGQWIIQGPVRSDGWSFFLTNYKLEGVRVKAGCRNFTLAEARTHWQNTRAGTLLGDETLAILDHMLTLAKLRGYDVGSE